MAKFGSHISLTLDMASDARDPKRYAAATAALGAAMVDMEATTHAPAPPKKTAAKGGKPTPS